MADEVHVFFKGKLPSRAAFNRAIRALGHPASLVDQKGPLEGQSGFMPMRLFREDGGRVRRVRMEGTPWRTRSGIDQSIDRRASFAGAAVSTRRFGYCGAVALGRLTGGVILDEVEGRVVSIDEATATATALLAARLAHHATPRHAAGRSQALSEVAAQDAARSGSCGAHADCPAGAYSRGAFLDEVATSTR